MDVVNKTIFRAIKMYYWKKLCNGDSMLYKFDEEPGVSCLLKIDSVSSIVIDPFSIEKPTMRKISLNWT